MSHLFLEKRQILWYQIAFWWLFLSRYFGHIPSSQSTKDINFSLIIQLTKDVPHIYAFTQRSCIDHAEACKVTESGLPVYCPLIHPPGTSYHSWKKHSDQVEFVINLYNPLSFWPSRFSGTENVVQKYWNFWSYRCMTELFLFYDSLYGHDKSPKCLDQ